MSDPAVREVQVGLRMALAAAFKEVCLDYAGVRIRDLLDVVDAMAINANSRVYLLIGMLLFE